MRARNLSKHSPKMSLLFRQLVTRAGKKPPHPTKDLEGYSFWVGNLLPTSRGDRQSVLQTRRCALPPHPSPARARAGLFLVVLTAMMWSRFAARGSGWRCCSS